LVKPKGSRLPSLAALLFIGVLFYQPIFRLLAQGVTTSSWHYLCSTQTLAIFWFTIWQAAVSTFIALLLATPCAYALYRVKFAGSSMIAALITIPFVLPTIVVAIGIKALWNGSGVATVIFANVFMNTGFAARAIGSAWMGLDRSIEEAAELDGAGKFATFTRVSIHALLHSYKNIGFLIFLYCSANFGLMLVIGGGRLKTLETTIYSSATQILNLPKAASFVLLQSALTVFALWVIRKHRYAPSSLTVIGEQSQAKKRDLPIIALTLSIVVVLTLWPIIAIVHRSFQSASGIGFANYTHLLSTGARNTLSITLGQATLNSLRNACISLVISLVIGLYLACAKPNQFLLALYRLPVGISAVVLGLGYLIAFTSGIFPLRTSWLVTPIAQALILIPLLIQIVQPAALALNQDFIELSRTDGLDAFEYWWFIQRPLLMQPILTAVGYLLIVSIGEFGAANFLSYGDQATLPTLLYQLISRPGVLNYGMAMAASALLIGFVAATTLAIDFYSRSPK
jgi:thiamine transport system permease protein